MADRAREGGDKQRARNWLVNTAPAPEAAPTAAVAPAVQARRPCSPLLPGLPGAVETFPSCCTVEDNGASWHSRKGLWVKKGCEKGKRGASKLFFLFLAVSPPCGCFSVGGSVSVSGPKEQ